MDQSEGSYEGGFTVSQIQMTDGQKFGNDSLSADQVNALRYKHRIGGSLTNLELEKLMDTALFALEELEHQLREEVK
jgi:hypothetical protein